MMFHELLNKMVLVIAGNWVYVGRLVGGGLGWVELEPGAHVLSEWHPDIIGAETWRDEMGLVMGTAPCPTTFLSGVLTIWPLGRDEFNPGRETRTSSPFRF